MHRGQETPELGTVATGVEEKNTLSFLCKGTVGVIGRHVVRAVAEMKCCAKDSCGENRLGGDGHP